MRVRGVLLPAAGVTAVAGLGLVARRRGWIAPTPPRLDAESRHRLSGSPVGLDRAGRDPGGGGSEARVHGPTWEPPSLTALATWSPAVPVSGPGRLLARVWAAPLSLVGLLVAGAGLTVPQPRDGVLLATGVRGLTGWLLARNGYSAMTWGHVIVSRREEPSPRLLAHELAHVRQAERLGPLFAPLYVGLLATHGYRRHPLERGARERALAEVPPPTCAVAPAA